MADLTKKFKMLSTSKKTRQKRRTRGTIVTVKKLTMCSDEDEAEGKSAEEELDRGYDPIADYWNIFSKPNPKTSTATVADLDLPSPDEMRRLANQLRSVNAKAQSELMAEYRTFWKEWVFYMHNGFNLLLTGVGSKKALIEEFALKHLNYGGLMVVHGFFRDMSIQRVLNTITQRIFKKVTITGGRDLASHADKIRAAMSWEKPPVKQLYIVIHNIEAEPLANPEAQTILAKLGSHPKIHLVASIDHFNATQLWDSRLRDEFSWITWSVPTFEPYIEELKEQPHLNPLERKSDDVERRAQGTKHVLDSLTPNHVEVLKVLAELMEETENGKDGLAFQTWFEECESQMMVSTDVQFRQYLEELEDHELVMSRRAQELGRLFYIPKPVLDNLDLD